MTLLFLALDAALYPTLLAAVVILLAQPRRLELLSVYLAGGMLISVGLGIAIVQLLATSGALDSTSATLSWTVDLAVGGVALLGAVALYERADQRVRDRRRAKHPKPKDDGREPWSKRLLARGSAPIVFAAALAINLPGAAYLVALKDISAGHHSMLGDIVLIVGFNLIMFVLAEVPLLGLIFAPDRTDALVHRMDDWLTRHGRGLAIGGCMIFGVFLITRGIIES